MRGYTLLLVFVLCVLLVAALISGCSQPDPDQPGPPQPGSSGLAESTAAQPSQPDGHQRMVRELERIAAQSRYLPFLGSAEAERLRRKWEGLGADATAKERFEVALASGQAELTLGNERDGIALLKEAYELVAGQDTPSRANAAFQLAVGYMRLGETENCCLRNSPESCILPIRGRAIHTKTEGSRTAIDYFTVVLQSEASESGLKLSARWLMNIAYMTIGEYPDSVPPEQLIPPQAFRSSVDFPQFVNVASKVGLDTFSLSGGVVMDDLDGDERLDLLVSTWHPNGQSRLFHNVGDGTFEDRTRQAGLIGIMGGLNLVHADYDNDGDKDVLFLRGAWLASGGQHPNSLVRNNGDGTFTDVTFEAGLGRVHYPTQTAAWADYDNDGHLDLFIGNETTPEISAPCQLFHNNGDGTFTDVARQAGVAYKGYPKGVGWGDYDGDNDPDLFVSEYKGQNLLYRNNGDGTFTDVAQQLGTTRPTSSFPMWFWDVNNDGALDIFVSSYAGTVQYVGAHYAGIEAQHERAALYLGNGRGEFEEAAAEMGLEYPMLPMGANFGDLDADGFSDIYLGTGDPAYHSLMPNLMFINREGLRFDDVTMAGGFGHLQKGHAVAFGDLDSDGDLDLFEQMGGAYPGDEFNDALYENPGFGNRWLSVELVGTESNRSAIGARIRLVLADGGEERSIYRHVSTGGSFGANPLRQFFGLGDSAEIDRLEILWPTTGRTQIVEQVAADRTIRISEGETGFTEVDLEPFRLVP